MIVNTKPSNKIQKNIIKAGAISASAIIPAAYMTKLHIDMFKKEDKQNRAIMRNKMLGFFAGVGLSVFLVHKRLKINNISNQAGKIILAAISPFAGIELAKAINKELYPDKFKSM